MFDIDSALTHLIEVEGSDLHLKVPSRPVIRRHGTLAPIAGSQPLHLTAETLGRHRKPVRILVARQLCEAVVGEDQGSWGQLLPPRPSSADPGPGC